MNIKRLLIIIMMATMAFATANAQFARTYINGGKNYTVSGRVMEAFEGTPMPNVAVEILDMDSTVVASTTTQDAKGDSYFEQFLKGRFNVELMALGKYIAKISCVGYETKYVDFQLKYKRERSKNIDDILLQKEMIMLDEVSVKATKIKMVMHGDTIVYNADAFHLAEGSMLDELVRRLPGAELSSDGQITINGKKIKTLLVNGKDFFTGDPKLALRNLPAYTVNKIKVFDQRGISSELTGRDMNDKSFVMDVRLKKEYSSGWIANAEAGYGTDKRYKVRAVGMHFTEVSKQMIFGSSNNLGQNSVYDANVSDWSGSGTPTVDSQYHMAGFAYHRQTKEGVKADKFSTTNNISYSDVNSKDWSSTQNFLEGGDTYGRTHSMSRNKDLKITSSNFFQKSLSTGIATTSLNFSYNKHDAEQQNFSAMFNADPISFRDLQQDVFGSENRFEDITLNRSKSISESANKNLQASFNSDLYLNMFGDFLRAHVVVSYDKQTGKNFSLSDYDYQQTGTSDHRNNYKDSPSHNFNLRAAASYNYNVSHDLDLSLDYGYNHQYNNTRDMLYRLDKLSDRDANTPYNVLPSTAAALNTVLDSPNSYTYGQHDITNSLQPSVHFHHMGKGDDMNMFIMWISVPIELATNSLDYFREQNYNVKQNRLNVNPDVSLSLARKGISYDLRASYHSSQPSMTSLITFRDDSNPLYVSLGNPDLKDTHNLQLSFGMNKRTMKSGFWFNAGYNRTYNAMATSTVYDKTTGVTTSTPTNINGNWNANATLSIDRNLDKDGRARITNHLSGTYMCSVDLNSVAGSETNELSKVGNTKLTDRLSLNWDITSKIRISLYASEDFTHQSSQREGFTTVNAHDIGYGGDITADLPWHLQLTSTIDGISRRGYSDSQMNTNEVVWNAKLNRSFFKGKLVATIEGYDILGQRSNRRYTLNSQGRTESYSNLIPSFGMVTLSYKFLKSPKKKGVSPTNSLW